ncbi:MAG: hypothetical protein M3R00_06895 [Pseudomonadota bacterium]|nr:hypothetical protein [Pseudomonadota bacterium]
MTNKDNHDLKEENFVDKHTTHVATPPEELPFEVELPEDSPRRKNTPQGTPSKVKKHPDDEEPAEDIPFEEVMPEDAPPRKNVSEEPPPKISSNLDETIKKNNHVTQDKSDENTPPVQP